MNQLVLATSWHSRGSRKLEAAKAVAEFDLNRLDSLLQAYLSYKSRKKAAVSDRTRATYAQGLRRWLAFCRPVADESPRVHPLRVEEEDVELYVMTLQEQGLAPETIRLYLSIVRSFHEALRWADLLTVNPAERVSAPSDSRPKHERREMVPFDNYDLLLEAAKGSDPQSLQDRVLLELLKKQALRVSEACNLTLADVDLERLTLTVRRGKGGKRRTAPLADSTLEALRAWLPVREGLAAGDSVLINIGSRVRADLRGQAMSADGARATMRRLSERAGVPYQACHSLRHTGLTDLYQKTKDALVTAEIGGHASPTTTLDIYAKRSADAARAAINS